MKLVTLDTLRSSLLASKKRLLGLDVGVKYLGVAVSDSTCSIAMPHSVLSLRQSLFMQTVETLESWTKEYNAAGFVIGYPINISGVRIAQTVKVDDFVANLRKTKKFDDLLYFLEDERFTSQLVESFLKGYKFSTCDHKAIVDKFSAVNILQACLDRFPHIAEYEASGKGLSLEDL